MATRKKRRRRSVQRFELTDQLWDRMLRELPKYKADPRGGRPRLKLRAVADAIFLVLRTGIQWLAIKKETAGVSGRSAHRYFQEWVRLGVFHRLWKAGLLEYDQQKGIQWSWQPADGATCKAPLGGRATGPNPTDRAKRGTKRSLQTDAAGVPIGIALDGANRNDHKMLADTISSTPVIRPSTKRLRQRAPLDKGYDYPDVHKLLKRLGLEDHTAARAKTTWHRKRGPGRRKARRWVVERTHSWMNRFRRLLVRWEKNDANYLGFLHFVCAILAFRAAGVLA